MDELFRLIGLALPDTPTIFRLKVAFGGFCGVGGGVLFMASGLDGSLARGGLMAGCGLVLIGVAWRDLVRAARQADVERARSV